MRWRGVRYLLASDLSAAASYRSPAATKRSSAGEVSCIFRRSIEGRRREMSNAPATNSSAPEREAVSVAHKDSCSTHKYNCSVHDDSCSADKDSCSGYNSRSAADHDSCSADEYFPPMLRWGTPVHKPRRFISHAGIRRKIAA